ncbi:MAG: hypothetical protein LBM65_05190 [Oscillospiraceae bacterium]|jgi:hypothetical protein|nr:hypothetical protein [Oscillospiraceae bacterium]
MPEKNEQNSNKMFSNERKDFIVYDDDWKNSSKPEVYTFTDAESDSGKTGDDGLQSKSAHTPLHFKNAKKINKPWLLIIQIVLCVAAVATVYTFKEISPPIYEQIKGWYTAQINNSVFISDLPGGIINGVVPSTTANSVNANLATNDEA